MPTVGVVSRDMEFSEGAGSLWVCSPSMKVERFRSSTPPVLGMEGVELPLMAMEPSMMRKKMPRTMPQMTKAQITATIIFTKSFIFFYFKTTNSVALFQAVCWA